MDQPEFALILERCLARLRQGESLPVCLADYPQQADELRPLLALSGELAHLPPLEPSPATTAHHLDLMLAAFDSQPRRTKRQTGWLAFLNSLFLAPGRSPRWAGRLARATALFLIVAAAAGLFVFTAAAESLPGDLFYPVKRSLEQTRLSLVQDEGARAALELTLNEQRLTEVEALQALGRAAEVDFEAVVESREGDTLVLNGLPVLLTGRTTIDGTIETGDQVAIEGDVAADGTITARKIVGRGENPPRPALPPAVRPTPSPTRQPVDGPTKTRTERPTSTSVPTRTPPIDPTPTREATRDVTRTDRPTPTPAAPAVDRATPTISPTRPPDREVKPTPEVKPTEPTDLPTQPPAREPTATPRPTKPSPRDAPPTATPARDGSGDGVRPP